MVIFRNYQWGAEKRNTTLWYDDNFRWNRVGSRTFQLFRADRRRPVTYKGVAVTKPWTELTEALEHRCRCKDATQRNVTTFIEVILNQELGEPFRRDAMKAPVAVAGIDPADMRPQEGAA